MHEHFRRLMARNQESNGQVFANAAAATSCLTLTVVALVIVVQVLLNPIGSNRSFTTSIQTDSVAPATQINSTPRVSLLVSNDGPGTDQTNDPIGNTPWFNGLSLSDQDQSLEERYSTPSRRPVTRNKISVAVFGGCHTNAGSYLLVLSGLTPRGKYTTQTDWNGNGGFNYGDANVADNNGRGVVEWSCFEPNMAELPSGTYSVLFRDTMTGFARTVDLRVG